MSDWIIAFLIYYFKDVILFIISICILIYVIKHYFWWIFAGIGMIALGIAICTFIDYLRGKPPFWKSFFDNVDFLKNAKKRK
jgi:membrane-bound metal-dependent hydrolase YbcI (DUF457 family)